MGKQWGAELGGLAGIKAIVGAIVVGSGFRAVSDDDFARVVIAERWAWGPRIDPSGTSWLPVPFWVNGAVMLGVGRSLEVARGVAFLVGIGAMLLVHRAALWMGVGRWGALLGAAIACVFPWSARLGVATVPELPTAALGVLAIAALATREEEAGEISRRRLWGGLSLLAASLSRYEIWPLAAGFALISLVDLRRWPGARSGLILGAIFALLGPLLWMAWNAHAHGDALHFVARVTAYRRALGGNEAGAGARLLAYPVALVREEPELFGMLGLAIAGGLAIDRAALVSSFRRFSRPIALVGLQIVLLALAMVKDGAPTHHPERAVLVALLLGALLAGELLAPLLLRRRAVMSIAALALLGATALLVRPRLEKEGFPSRGDEVAIGALARGQVPAMERVLVEVVDYGHLAVMASLGRPEQVVLDRSIDPRDPPVASSFADAGALRARLGSAGARFVVGRASPVCADVLGAPLASAGAWSLWQAPGSLGNPLGSPR